MAAIPESGKALLFDIDGTLADTDALHLQAFNQVLGPHGHVFDHARYTRELQVSPTPRSASGFWRTSRQRVRRPSSARRKLPFATSFPNEFSRCPA
jgi:beta-phosphoglucomutase-like phosphatase (HAD superfamily)